MLAASTYLKGRPKIYIHMLTPPEPRRSTAGPFVFGYLGLVRSAQLMCLPLPRYLSFTFETFWCVFSNHFLQAKNFTDSVVFEAPALRAQVG